MREYLIDRFIAVPAHSVRKVAFFNDKGDEIKGDVDPEKVSNVLLQLERTDRNYRCGCGYQTDYYYDYQERFVLDLPWGPWGLVELIVPRFRIECPHCGVKTEPLDWLVPNCTYTRRLARMVALACREVRSIKAIAESFGLGWDTVKKIDKEALEEHLNPPDFTGVRRLGLDEFSLRKGHRYATAFVDLDTGRPLWVCQGRDSTAIKKVFRKVFKKAVCQQIKVVSMDMWEAYEKAVKECLPRAAIVWDRFHIIKNYQREVLDRVRIDEAKKCQTDEERKQWKKSRWLILKNRENLREDEPAKLEKLLAANKPLSKAYVLREVLRQCWSFDRKREAKMWFNGWYERAVHSRVSPLVKFAQKLKRRLPGILAHCYHPVNNGLMEGLNNLYKVVKRVAFGYRDVEYFSLKIRGLWLIGNST